MKKMDFLMSLAMIANVVVGILSWHWAMIGVFAVVHAAMRYAYLRQENTTDDAPAQELQRIQAAMPLLRHVATWLAAVILAAILYGMGWLVMFFVGWVMR